MLYYPSLSNFTPTMLCSNQAVNSQQRHFLDLLTRKFHEPSVRTGKAMSPVRSPSRTHDTSRAKSCRMQMYHMNAHLPRKGLRPSTNVQVSIAVAGAHRSAGHACVPFLPVPCVAAALHRAASRHRPGGRSGRRQMSSSESSRLRSPHGSGGGAKRAAGSADLLRRGAPDTELSSVWAQAWESALRRAWMGARGRGTEKQRIPLKKKSKPLCH
jgi:hypothetical protein